MNRQGKVFSSIISDRNTESKGLAKKQQHLREGQRSNLHRMGISKRLIRKSIEGR